MGNGLIARRGSSIYRTLGSVSGAVGFLFFNRQLTVGQKQLSRDIKKKKKIGDFCVRKTSARGMIDDFILFRTNVKGLKTIGFFDSDLLWKNDDNTFLCVFVCFHCCENGFFIHIVFC